MSDKNKTTKEMTPEEIEKNLKAKKAKDEKYFEQPPSDSDEEICGPLNCDKEL